jgi:hypothetical protein
MAKRKADTARGQAGSTGDSMEKRMLAFAEQVGRIAGTVQAKAEGWLDRNALTAQIASIRDSATDLLQQIGATASDEGEGATSGNDIRRAANRSTSSAKPAKAASSRTSPASAPKRRATGKQPAKVRASSTSGAAVKKGATKNAARGRSGGAVDAPGKKHRGPMPSEAGAIGRPRGDGARLAKLKAANMNRMQRRG